MEKIYEQTNDLHVRNIIFYAANGTIYADKDYKKGVTSAQIKDAFLKGQILIDYQKFLNVPIRCDFADPNGVEIFINTGNEFVSFLVVEHPEAD